MRTLDVLKHAAVELDCRKGISKLKKQMEENNAEEVIVEKNLATYIHVQAGVFKILMGFIL